ncbi:MAG: MarR family winged helix-turn-helix transcriptional regulator [Pseudolactococcus laudensis]|uniref:MarR family winged helix-turn-helix transcriptional regulator n=1 Tax=Pseudolactococcus laudensis TaxID=1494461 RepID=UPI003F9740C2
MTKVSKELYDNLGKLLRFFRQPPGGGGGRRGAENNAQIRVLEFLDQSETAKTTGEIAEQLEIRQQSASELVSKLAKKSWVNKTKDDKDKRVTLVTLTEEGREMINDITKREGDYYQQFFDVLTDAEQVELNRLVKKLFDNKFDNYMPNRKNGLITTMIKREQMKRDLLDKK